MKKPIHLSFALLLLACGGDSEEPEVIIEKPNVKTSITQTTSSSCPLGGYDILVFDDANSNGSQDAAEELFLESTVCFEENRNITTKVSNLDSDECEFGGLLISVYDDANSNSTIDQTEEVFHEIAECFPRDANVQTYIVDADLETCPVGGKSITVYDDVNANQIPDEGEQIFYTGSECYPDQDIDKDGIFDDNDLCPDTDPGLEVDDNGCALNQKDTDGDGVTDDLDLCPNTPTGAAVNETGCAADERDTDGDGVTDDLDQCPNTQQGLSVNADGCEINTIYIDPTNGITVKCPNANVGDVAVINGKTYTVVGNKAETLAIIDDLDDTTCACTSKITNMSNWIASRPIFEDITDWDTSNVTNMSQMFVNNSTFNQEIGMWDVSKVTNMSSMFSTFSNNNKSNFNQYIGNWDVSSVTTMEKMFYLSNSFNQDISGWDVSSVTNMGEMFYLVSVFNQDLSGWNVSSVTNMYRMFRGAISFNSNIGAWDVSSVNNMAEMFLGASTFNQDLSNWNVSSVTNMSGIFQEASTFNQDLGNWDVSMVTGMTRMFQGAGLFNQDLSQWNTERVTSMSNMFLNAINFNQDLSGWNVDRVINCGGFSNNTPAWILSKPNFTLCTP